jgi:tetratricopeptide (TPR) repeat protein
MKNRNKLKKNNINKTPIRNLWLKGALGIALLIFVLYSQTFKFDFVNWDDHVNVYENENVINFDVKGIFTEHVIGNYNPLSNLTFAVEYKFVKDNPELYHFNNVLLHLMCTLLVFVFMKRLGMSFFVSFLVAILFGIHPMRVESVAWITERKDVLFGTFYLGSLILYISYIKTKKSVFYILSLVAFSFSLLSKIQAVALPFSVMLIDYWFDKKLTLKSLAEKIPFFFLSLVTGIAGIYFLKQQGSLDVGTVLPLSQRIFIGSYSYMVYLIKSVFPYQMSALYPLPVNLNIWHYLSMLPALTTVFVSVLFVKKRRFVTFGLLFFTLNIVFLLQVIGAGTGYIADRFTYIPYLGLFFMYAIFLENVLNRFQSQKNIIYTLITFYIVLLSLQTVKQIKTWENGETLWSDVIEKHPSAVLAYNNLAQHYSENNDSEKALLNYSIAIKLLPDQSPTYNSRGKTYYDLKQYENALDDYNTSLKIDPENMDALANRGAVYGALKMYEKAIEDFTKVIENNPDNSDALSNRGFIYYQLKQFDKSIPDFTNYLRLKPGDTEVINLSGLSYAGLNDFDMAINEYNRAINSNPEKPIYYANRSFAFYTKGDKKSALNDAKKAIEMGITLPQDFMDAISKQ